MDAMVPDDGWQDHQSIWAPRKDVYPHGFAPLAHALEAGGTRLGVWLPFNGTNLDINWGVAHGYEKSNKGNFYCLVAPHYSAAIHAALKQDITDGNLSYMKHDFNDLQCSAPGHGHLPDDRHGHEKNLDAELSLMAYERQIQPGIFLNITSDVWFSPWWLQHADSIWMCSGDNGYDNTWPQLSPRDWQMSYRDHHLYGVYQVEHKLVPVSALMTHGIIKGRYADLGGDQETMREWSDNAVLYYGRGVQLKELYITPSMVPKEWWKPLGEATRWAVANARTLNSVVMVGGDCAKGQPYGYVHFEGDHAIVVVRNPDLAAQTLQIPFDKSVRYRGPDGRPFHLKVIYPFVETQPDKLVSGVPIHLLIPGATVIVCQIEPGKAPASRPAAESLKPVAFTADKTAGGVTVQVSVPAEKMQRAEIIVVQGGASGRGSSPAPVEIRLNGQPAKGRTASGPGWSMLSVDVQSMAGKTVGLSVGTTEPASNIFRSPDRNVSIWWVADRPVKDGPAPQGQGLDPVAQGFRRQTDILAKSDVQADMGPSRHLTAADLAGIKAARLRIDVFGTNPEEQYRHKFIYLNGQKLIEVPVQGDTWDTRILDLTPAQLQLIRLSNQLQLDNAGGDDYKFGGVSLAVQLADGAWVESSRDNQVYCSVPDWQYNEGTPFQDNRSPTITLSFE
jgi:hypothetical protein